MKGKTIQRILLALMAAAAAVMLIGYIKLEEDLAIAVYKTIQAFVLETDAEEIRGSELLLIGAYLAPLSLAGAIIIGVFEAVREALAVAAIRLFYRNHIVIAGPAGQVVRILAEWEPTERIVALVEEDSSDPTLEEKRSRTLTISDNLATYQAWKRSAAGRAKAVILLGNDLEVLTTHRQALRRAAGRAGVPRLFLGLENPMELEALGDMYGIQERSCRDKPVRAFSVTQTSASFLAQEFLPHRHWDQNGMEKTKPHVVFDGFNPFAGQLAAELAQLYIYPSLQVLQISVIPTDLEDPVRAMGLQYPGLNQVVDLKSYPRTSFLDALRLSAPTPLSSSPQVVYLFRNSIHEFAEAARGWRRFLAKTSGDSHMLTDIVAVLPGTISDATLAGTLQTKLADLRIRVVHPGIHLNPGRLLEDETLIDSMARNIHERYRRMYSMAAWQELSYREMEANRRSARHYLIKLAWLGYSISEERSSGTVSPESIPELSEDQILVLARMEHQRWMVEKYLDDFLPEVQGSENPDPAIAKKVLRLHKDLKGFSELSDEDIAKDVATFEEWKSIMSDVLGRRYLQKREIGTI